VDKTPPTILFSTTKHLPVPFIEGFPLTPRDSPEFGSSSSALPLGRITLPYPPKTPSPHLTPLQTLDLSAAMCLDVTSPSLFTRYTSSASSSHQSSSQYPSLIINPSSLPLDSPYLISQQLSQASTRALETGAFILRCDSAGGASALLGPDGISRVMRRGEEGWTS
jgi:predicted amidohydrolase